MRFLERRILAADAVGHDSRVNAFAHLPFTEVIHIICVTRLVICATVGCILVPRPFLGLQACLCLLGGVSQV